MTTVGAGLALVGLYLLTVTAAFTVNPGDVLRLVGTVFWTGHILSVGHFSRRLDALRLSVAQFGACALYAAVAALFLDAALFAGVPDACSAPCCSLGSCRPAWYTLQVVAQQDALESHAAIIMSLESMFGAIGAVRGRDAPRVRGGGAHDERDHPVSAPAAGVALGPAAGVRAGSGAPPSTALAKE